ncbi:MAG: Fpg/Nei family DNA glycosylase [Acidimicrobiales bacterium]
MPELLEVEVYRRLADRVVGRTIRSIEAPDDWFLKGGLTSGDLRDALDGATVVATGRIGKLLLVDVGAERPTLGLRFGMTGRLVLDDEAPVAHLEYASRRDDAAWDRFALGFTNGSRLRLSDSRRLGGIELDPDVNRLGPDVWTLTVAQLRRALLGSSAPLKARLLDQSKVAGLGNLLVDEALWRAGLDPARPARGLSDTEVRRLARHVRATVALLFERGGSHTGDLHVQRVRGGHCPKDGVELARRTIGGRTTYSCPRHQLTPAP